MYIEQQWQHKTSRKRSKKTHIHIPEQASNEYLMGNLILQFAPPSHHLQTFFPLSVRIFSPLFDSNNICLNRADISIKSLKVSIKNSSPARGTWNWIRGAVVEPMAYWQKTEIDFNPNAICFIFASLATVFSRIRPTSTCMCVRKMRENE